MLPVHGFAQDIGFARIRNAKTEAEPLVHLNTFTFLSLHLLQPFLDFLCGLLEQVSTSMTGVLSLVKA